MNRMKRNWLALTLITVLAMAAVTTAETTKPVPAATAPSFTEVALKKGSITQNVIAIGSLRFDGTESLKILEKVTLQTIEVNEGESVSKGQILARYDEDALKTGLEIMDMFVQLHRQGNTIVLITHDANLAQHAQRSLHIVDGQIQPDEQREVV